MTAKKKYYTTKNEIISNLQNQLAMQQKAHESEIKKLQDEGQALTQPILEDQGALKVLEKLIGESAT